MPDTSPASVRGGMPDSLTLGVDRLRNQPTGCLLGSPREEQTQGRGPELHQAQIADWKGRQYLIKSARAARQGGGGRGSRIHARETCLHFSFNATLLLV